MDPSLMYGLCNVVLLLRRKMVRVKLHFINSLHKLVPSEGECLCFYTLQLIEKKESNAEGQNDYGRKFIRVGFIQQLLKCVLIV